MILLEREIHLDALRDASVRARSGQGCTVLVSGEAGIGKTSLVRHFAQSIAGDMRVLWGTCEALFTPRPLGAFHDIAHAVGGSLLERLEGNTKPVDLFHGLLQDLLEHPRTTVVILEDVHWADHGTLDFVRFLARRIDRTHAMLVITFRDDETGALHPLTTVLGVLPSDSKVRVKLPPLSRTTVEWLASQAGREATPLFRVTQGNPFFVNEMLRDDAAVTAVNVREAVLARTRTLSPAGRALLDVVALAPDRIEYEVVDAVRPPAEATLDECIGRGFLEWHGNLIGFRHELARLAIEQALPPLAKRRIHAEILAALAHRGGRDEAMLTRLAHHAIAAGDGAAIIRHVPAAALAASNRGAHREAAILLDAAIVHAEAMALPDRARLCTQRARACLLMARNDEAIAMGKAARNAWRAAGEVIEEGKSIVRLCELIWAIRPPEIATMRDLGAEAIRLLAPAGDADSLALAHWWHRLPESFERVDIAAVNRETALTLANETASEATRIATLIGLTTLEYVSDGVPGATTVRRLAIEARQAQDDHGIMMAYARQGWRAFRDRDLAALEQVIAEGRAFARERQLEQFVSSHALDQFAAEVSMARGHWEEARAAFEEVDRRATLPWFFRLPYCKMPLALLRARTNQPVDGSWQVAAQVSDPRLLRMERQLIDRAIAEFAWLTGDVSRAAAAVRRLLEVAAIWNHPWSWGEALTWARIIGIPADVPAGLPPVYAMQLSGEAHGAAAAWRERGYIYESGFALLLGNEDAIRDAIGVFEEIGASATADRARDRLRGLGAKSIPAGPRARTRAHPAGLTGREAEVLALLAYGLSNTDIARRLHRSVRTVEHHVTSLIDKLGVDSRQRAVAVARERGLLAP